MRLHICLYQVRGETERPQALDRTRQLGEKAGRRLGVRDAPIVIYDRTPNSNQVAIGGCALVHS